MLKFDINNFDKNRKMTPGVIPTSLDLINLNVQDKYKGNTVEQNQAIAKATTKNFAVATFDLKGDLNLGTIMRSAHLTGARDFFILNHRQWDRRSAVGVHNYLNVEKHDECTDWPSTQKFLYSRDYDPVVVEQGGVGLELWLREKGYYKNEPQLKPCFIFGPEDTGFPIEWPRDVSLEQTGVSRSYNVSAAAAIILYMWSFT